MQQDSSVAEAAEMLLSEEQLGRLGALVQQTPATVRVGLRPLLRLVNKELRKRVVQPHGEEALWTLVQTMPPPAAVLEQLPTQDTANQGRGVQLMQALLQEQYQPALRQLLVAAQLPPSAGAVLLEVAVALVLHILRNRAQAEAWDAVALSSWLQQLPAPGPPSSYSAPEAPAFQPLPVAEPLLAAAPAPPETVQRFTVAGAGTWEKVGGGLTFTPASVATPKPTELPHWKWTLLLVPLLGLGYLSKHHPAAPAASIATGVPAQLPLLTPTAPATPAVAAPAPASAALPAAAVAPEAGELLPVSARNPSPQRQPVLLRLPDGRQQRVAAQSAEHRLYRLLAKPPLEPASGSWLALEGVQFAADQATLTPESWLQLRNLASILRAFPQAYIKLGSPVENTASTRKNRRLSQQRATAALRALMRLGVPANQLLTSRHGAPPELLASAATSAGPGPELGVQVLPKPAALGATQPKTATGPVSRGMAVGAAQAGNWSADKARRQPRTKVGKWLQRVSKRLRGRPAAVGQTHPQPVTGAAAKRG